MHSEPATFTAYRYEHSRSSNIFLAGAGGLCRGAGAIEEQIAFAHVLCEGGSVFEFSACLRPPLQLRQEVAAKRRQQMLTLKRFGSDGVHEFDASMRQGAKWSDTTGWRSHRQLCRACGSGRGSGG